MVSSISLEKAFLGQSNIDKDVLIKNVDLLTQFVAKYSLEPLSLTTANNHLNQPDAIGIYLDKNVELTIPKSRDQAIEQEKYFLRVSYKIEDLKKAPIGDLLITIADKINKLGIVVKGVNINFEKGYLYPFAPKWHKDFYEISVIVSWSNIDGFATRFKVGDETSIVIDGGFYDAKNYFHRSPVESDLRIIDGKDLSADSYRLFIQFFTL